jgi:hypothetical protein
MSAKPCGRPVTAGPTPHGVVDGINIDGCAYPRMKGKQQCMWHWLLKQPAGVQAHHAARRLAEKHESEYRSRVPAGEWPPGERWCSGCQSFVPLFYVQGSRCRSCNSEAAHAGRVEKTYGITAEEYDALFKLQGGRCYICQREAKSRRLAVDHDHRTNEVRGLLCSDNKRGCNHAILGNIKDLAMAKRIVEYLENPPYQRLGRGEALADWAAPGSMGVPQVAQEGWTGALPQQPPF